MASFDLSSTANSTTLQRCASCCDVDEARTKDSISARCRAETWTVRANGPDMRSSMKIAVL